MVASLLTKKEATAKAWVNAGKVESVEEYYAQVKGTSAAKQFVADPMQHSHEDGTSHSHSGGNTEHTHEEKPKRRRSRRKS